MKKHTWTKSEMIALIEEARTWINTPFRHQGRSRKGVDCIGYLAASANRFGANVELPTDYSLDVDPVRFKNDLKKHFEEIPLSRAIWGDLIVVRYQGKSTHLVLRTPEGIIHASRQYRKVVEHGFEGDWKRGAIMAFRLPGRRIDE